ncbi:restriction endonuclease subunit S [Sessilibacter corallicola]|uniref:Type I restriction modification DNA specificity domain-containing protein n=1 Tax=Sessilibacter corallicola TaxID=2904075 RepID=A0ABQ0A630_9GAMM
MSELQKKTLRECLSLIIDNRGKTPPKIESGLGYKILSANHVKFDGLVKVDSIECGSAETYSKWMTEELQRGDILLTSEAPAGQVMLWDSDEKVIVAQRLFALRTNPKLADSKFIKYYLQSNFGQKEITRNTSGSTVFGISARMFDQINVHLPECTSTQSDIGNILYSLDRKIELNNRINAELEAMAKTLYDYWFVQFDFPDANGNPYKSSGGKMVYNSTLKREIPEGWETDNVLKVAHILGGGTPTKTKKEYWNGAIPFFTPTDSDGNIFSIETEDYITAEGLKKSSTRLFEPYTVFITARGSVGRLALNAVPMAMNQSCYALRAKDGISYTFLFFLTKELIHHLEVKASGSVFNSIVSNDIEYTNLALPSDSALMDKYATIVEPIFEKIESTTKENKKLSSLRDWLLPMLMNGQVTVGEAS